MSISNIPKKIYTIADRIRRSRGLTPLDGRDLRTILDGLKLNPEPRSWSRGDISAFIARCQYYQTPDKLDDTQVEKRSYLLSVDSNDRDKELYPNPSEFSIVLDSIKGTGRNYKNAVSVEVVSVIIPTQIVDGDDSDDFSYVLLQIPEIGGIYDSTRPQVSAAIAKLRFSENLGSYREYKSGDGDNFKKYFYPRREIGKLTFRLVKPNGKLYNLGTTVKRRKRLTIVTRVTNEGTVEEVRKSQKFFYNGVEWMPLPTDITGCANNSKPADIDGDGEPDLTPTCLNDLPDSGVVIVLKVCCLQPRIRDYSFHRH